MSTPVEMFIKWETETPDAVAFQQPFGGEWRTWTWKEAGQEIRKIAAGIKALNLAPKSKIALLSKNCAHWIIADLAIMMCGYISVPLYPTLTAESLRQILEHSESRAIIVGKLDSFATQQSGIPSTVEKIIINLYNASPGVSWEEMISKNSPLTTASTWDPNETVTIMYTSGTTGGPKGVMHSLSNFATIYSVTKSDLNLPHHPRLFSYLPLSHIAERAGIEIYGLYSGALFSFTESLESFPADLMHVQPQIFFAVPRIWSKFREKILEKIPQSRLDVLLAVPLISGIIKTSIRKKLGVSKATHIYSGAAPISVELLQWFKKIDITIFQALGMTEDCLYSHFNTHRANKFGTVGKHLTGVSVKISPEGELRLKSTAMMKGYFKDPHLTAEAFDEQGFLKTGDIAEIDKDGFLSITGRIKDQFKTDKGKYISPTPIETLLLADSYIEQVCVVGVGIPQPIALIVLSAAGKARNKGEINKSLNETIAAINATLQKFEKIEKAVIIKNDWTIDNGLLTPTLKVKRNEVERIKGANYVTWYKSESFVVYEQ